MKNKPYFYTAHDVACSRDILAACKEDAVNALRLYPASWITWAYKVRAWYSKFVQVLRRYARLMKGAALAVKAIWDNIKNGISIPYMLRLLLVKEHQPPARWQRNRGTERGQVPAVQLINPKTNRTERRGQIIRQTAVMQSFI